MQALLCQIDELNRQHLIHDVKKNIYCQQMTVKASKDKNSGSFKLKICLFKLHILRFVFDDTVFAELLHCILIQTDISYMP